MRFKSKNLLEKICVVVAMFVLPVAVCATSRTDGQTINRSSRSDGSETGAVVSRSATTPVSGRSTKNVIKVDTPTTARSITTGVSRSSSARSVSGTGGGTSRSATTARSITTGVSRSGMSRSATPSMIRSAVSGIARAGVQTGAHLSRSGMSRATAVFSDVSKIGGGYATCREAWATCMDQFCANANDSYRRCFCSSRYTDFRDTEDALDQAKVLLTKFEDNNLNAVDKSAAEVDAMYSATVGELAIKNDTSSAQATLDAIGDLLSGKKTKDANSLSVSGLIDVDLSLDTDDIWGDGSSGGIFSTQSKDMSSLEGESLYNSAMEQCVKVIADSCENDAVFTMSKSAYSMMITQDCNVYETSINTKKEAIKQTVRQAEKYLREARLDDYRNHNSADVNECIDRVRTAITADTACGANYVRCLDYSGAYINATSGEPIYSPRLFKLNDLIVLNGTADVLSQNPQFVKFLDGYRKYAASALDSCRGIADTVWTEFERSAIIEIAQAQDEKIEEVKMSCVSTMKDCYDTQSNAIKSFDDTTAQAAGALSVYAAKAMCQDKVLACATLYGDGSQTCQFDGNGKLKSTGSNCGLTALLAFVDTVDDNRVAESCSTAIENYTKELCTPSTGDYGYPWNCRMLTREKLADNIANFAIANCSNVGNTQSAMAYSGHSGRSAVSRIVAPRSAVLSRRAVPASKFGEEFEEAPKMMAKFFDNNQLKEDTESRTFDVGNYLNGSYSKSSDYGQLLSQTQTQIELAVSDIIEQISGQMLDICESDGIDGYWVPYNVQAPINSTKKSSAFYRRAFGGDTENTTYGTCYENTTMTQCLAYNTDDNIVATYNATKDECEFTDAWYENKCNDIGGLYEDAVCYVASQN